MLRRITAVFLGCFLSVCIFFILQYLISRQFPPPDDFNVADKGAMAAFWRSLPNKMFIFVTFAHSLSGFIGAFITSSISDKYKVYFGMIVGIFFIAAAITYMSVVLVPTWMIIADPLAIIIFTFVGAKLGSKTKKERQLD